MRATAGGRAWAVLMLLAASAVAAAGEEPIARPELVVLWSDPEQRVPEAVKRRLFDETAVLFAGWGVTLRSSEDLDSGGEHDVRVVLLERSRLGHGGDLVLGQTHVERQEFPVVWILVPNVREVLERKGFVASSPVIARALARVAAHEILHVLGFGHAPQGLMRRGLDASELTSPWVRVSNGFQRSLLVAVTPRVRQAAVGRP
jgi:hypothetical protein